MTKVLIIEDNMLNRDMLGRRLKRRGYSICFAVDGAGGVAAAASEQPDLILMDIGLGEIDGWEATRRIRANPATAAIPIIALTASAFASGREKSFQAGCNDFDTKPVDLARLLQKMESCLAASGATAPSAASPDVLA